MRILRSSNFGLDWYDEDFILWPMQDCVAQEIADALNKDSGKDGQHYYRVVDNEYKLYKGMVP